MTDPAAHPALLYWLDLKRYLKHQILEDRRTGKKPLTLSQATLETIAMDDMDQALAVRFGFTPEELSDF